MNPKEQLAGLVEKWRKASYTDSAAMKFDKGVGYGKGECADDLAAIIATLPESGVVSEEDEVVCLECGQPTMHMGQICYACSHPKPAPAAQGDACPRCAGVGFKRAKCPSCGQGSWSDTAAQGGDAERLLDGVRVERIDGVPFIRLETAKRALAAAAKGVGRG